MTRLKLNWKEVIIIMLTMIMVASVIAYFERRLNTLAAHYETQELATRQLVEYMKDSNEHTKTALDELIGKLEELYLIDQNP